MAAPTRRSRHPFTAPAKAATVRSSSVCSTAWAVPRPATSRSAVPNAKHRSKFEQALRGAFETEISGGRCDRRSDRSRTAPPQHAPPETTRSRPLPRRVIVVVSAAAQGGSDIRQLDGTHDHGRRGGIVRQEDARRRPRHRRADRRARSRERWCGARAFGLRRREPPLPMDRDTTTWAASITKSVFATYVMQLVERGEFSLDAPVARQLPRPLDTYDAVSRDGVGRSSAIRRGRRSRRACCWRTPPASRTSPSFEPDKKMHLHFKPGTQYPLLRRRLNLVQFVIEQQKGRPLDQLDAGGVVHASRHDAHRHHLPHGVRRQRRRSLRRRREVPCRRQSAFPRAPPAR